MVEPRGALPQAAARLDNDFTRLFEGEVLIAVEALNLDAASFAQIERAAGGDDAEIAHIVLRTVQERGKQHNPVTGSGGMLLGRVVQVVPGNGRAARGANTPAVGGRIATLVSLTLTPLRLDRVRAVRRPSAQLDVDGEAVLFASGAYADLPGDMPERLALAALDVAGAAPQVARLVEPGAVVVVLGAGGKSGLLCAAEARRSGGPGARVVGVEANPLASDDLRALGFCDAVVVADARDAIGLRRAVLGATGGREADLTVSCVNVPDAEVGAILCTRDRGAVYFFAMSTSFTQAALGAEGVGKDVDLHIGNGYARDHAAHTLSMLRDLPGLRAVFERRYAG
ncbi:MAG TPA: L-erythro-3,5-diaminohexanoate dehydrogenase [Polyangiaceae bacterium]|nr:L-erythro-3,5-diaminohexanoate dehydrogenase [Polyangiaceae bacterium]